LGFLFPDEDALLIPRVASSLRGKPVVRIEPRSHVPVFANWRLIFLGSCCWRQKPVSITFIVALLWAAVGGFVLSSLVVAL
jgi:hypothetical protein